MWLVKNDITFPLKVSVSAEQWKKFIDEKAILYGHISGVDTFQINFFCDQRKSLKKMISEVDQNKDKTNI